MTADHSFRSRGRRRVASTVAVVVVSALTLVGCSASADVSPGSSESVLADHGLSGLEAPQIIERLERTPVADRPTNLMASIRPSDLVLTDDQNREARVPMPEDRFYVSIAPYVNQTHDCYFHSLTTCLGELRNENVDVSVTDNTTGEVVIDQPLRTYGNGFVGLWLPRDLDATLTIEHEGRTAASTISTARDDDPTCLTALQLT